MALGILAIIAAIGSAIWGGIKFVGDKLLSFATVVFDFMKSGFDWFLRTAPRWLQILFFFFIIIVLADTIVGFFVGISYACTSEGELRTPSGIAGGIGLFFSSFLEGAENSTIDYDTYVLEQTIPAKQYTTDDPRGIFYVRCFDDSPKFTFAGLNFLNWQYWTIILVIGAIFKVAHALGIFRR
jgi:hypothetical protein